MDVMIEEKKDVNNNPQVTERVIGGVAPLDKSGVGLLRLENRHLLIIEMMIEGTSNKEIARRTGIAAHHIDAFLGSPVFQHELSRRRDEQRKDRDERLARQVSESRSLLGDNLQRATQKLIEMVDDEDPKVRQGAINKIMDECYSSRSGLAILDAENKKGNVLLVNVQHLENLSVALKEAQELTAPTAATAVK